MILKGRILHFLDNGNIENPENSFEYIEKGGLVISGEKIIDIGVTYKNLIANKTEAQEIISSESDTEMVD